MKKMSTFIKLASFFVLGSAVIGGMSINAAYDVDFKQANAAESQVVKDDIYLAGTFIDPATGISNNWTTGQESLKFKFHDGPTDEEDYYFIQIPLMKNDLFKVVAGGNWIGYHNDAASYYDKALLQDAGGNDHNFKVHKSAIHEIRFAANWFENPSYWTNIRKCSAVYNLEVGEDVMIFYDGRNDGFDFKYAYFIENYAIESTSPRYEFKTTENGFKYVVGKANGLTQKVVLANVDENGKVIAKASALMLNKGMKYNIVSVIKKSETWIQSVVDENQAIYLNKLIIDLNEFRSSHADGICSIDNMNNNVYRDYKLLSAETVPYLNVIEDTNGSIGQQKFTVGQTMAFIESQIINSAPTKGFAKEENLISIVVPATALLVTGIALATFLILKRKKVVSK